MNPRHIALQLTKISPVATFVLKVTQHWLKAADGYFVAFIISLLTPCLCRENGIGNPYSRLVVQPNSPNQAYLHQIGVTSYSVTQVYAQMVISDRLKPNSITLAGSKLVADQLRTSFEPASVMEFGFYFAGWPKYYV